jgi:ketosteroid isomerase-like protein
MKTPQQSFLTTFFLILICSFAFADNSTDEQAIRDLFEKEQQAHVDGDVKAITNSYWPEFHVVWIPFYDGKPRYLLASIWNKNNYMSNIEGDDWISVQDRMDDPKIDLEQSSGVNHLHINGNIATVITQFQYANNTEDGHRQIAGHKTIWVAEKRNKVWKWAGATAGFDSFSQLIRMGSTHTTK